MSFKIYTRVGDKGTTSLFGGKKVAKHHLRIDSYGNVDELNSFIGLLRDQQGIDKEIDKQLLWIQELLFSLGTILATEEPPKGFVMPVISQQEVSQLEKWIDEYTEKLPELKNFILPGGHPVVSLCHVCRTVCRRTERSIVALEQSDRLGEFITPFVNRLSDYFFTLARMTAQLLNVQETAWKP